MFVDRIPEQRCRRVLLNCFGRGVGLAVNVANHSPRKDDSLPEQMVVRERAFQIAFWNGGINGSLDIYLH